MGKMFKLYIIITDVEREVKIVDVSDVASKLLCSHNVQDVQ